MWPARWAVAWPHPSPRKEAAAFKEPGLQGRAGCLRLPWELEGARGSVPVLGSAAGVSWWRIFPSKQRGFSPRPHPRPSPIRSQPTSSLGNSGEQFGPFFLHTIEVESRSLAHSNTTWNTLFLSLSFEKHDLII